MFRLKKNHSFLVCGWDPATRASQGITFSRYIVKLTRKIYPILHSSHNVLLIKYSINSVLNFNFSFPGVSLWTLVVIQWYLWNQLGVSKHAYFLDYARWSTGNKAPSRRWITFQQSIKFVMNTLILKSLFCLMTINISWVDVTDTSSKWCSLFSGATSQGDIDRHGSWVHIRQKGQDEKCTAQQDQILTAPGESALCWKAGWQYVAKGPGRNVC